MSEDLIRGGRAAYERRAWGDCFAALSQFTASGALDVEDVERLAWSAVLTGHAAESFAAFERLHQLHLDAGDLLRAGRAAFWLGMRLNSLGESARGGGWLTRARTQIEQHGKDCVEHGYLKLPVIFRASAQGDHAAARTAAAEMTAVAERYADKDLRALGRNYEGRALIRLGKVAEGLLLVDDAMVTVTSGELSPVVTGLIYCNVIATCQQSYALSRAREWTAALDEWCQAQPQLVAFTGACLVHRSEIKQLGGAWPEAFAEAQRAATQLSPTNDTEAGNAFYQEGELHRLRGELAEAEQAYVRAGERGRDPQPGRALLRLAEGRVDLAAAATRRVLAATTDPLQRARFLPSHVEIMVAAADLDEARRGASELSSIARDLGMEMLDAISDHANGAVTLAEGDARAAIEPLRRAQQVWHRLGAPYLSARIRVLLARAFHVLADEDSSALELAGAKKIFAQLGAAPDLAAIEQIVHTPVAAPGAALGSAAGGTAAAASAHGLSPREREVLLLVAAGKTNRTIARELFLSEKTVDRHVSNIFVKIAVSTRAAATAWAYQHGLIG